MKFGSIAVPAALALLASAQSEDNQSDVEHPPFKPFDVSKLESAAFFEQFDSDDWANLWKISKAKRDEEFTYNGVWDVEESIIFPGLEGDKGLVLKSAAAHHAISARLKEPFDNKGDTLVLQYEVKLQDGLNCGGAYVKLLSEDGAPSDANEFSNETPYQVMFGPDKCGRTNKVHFIIRRKDPFSGEYEEHHLSIPPLSRSVKTSTLYTLIIEPNQDYQIRINGDVVKAGNLLDEDELTPGLNPPTEIDDPSDFKPEDWDDEQYILDPTQLEKPEDWDEDAPYLIPDPEATKPESWEEDTPEYIPDPEAEKPEDWDDEEDGEWIAPQIFNPECENHGCGPWESELIPNPDYKGKWSQPSIENPNYKGEWQPRKIANPNYYEDKTPSDLEPIGALGFELWSMEKNILFDNIYLGHSINDAELLGNETWKPKYEIETEEVLAITQKAKDADKPDPELFKDEDEGAFEKIQDFIQLQSNNVKLYFSEFLESPLETLSNKPIEGFIYISGFFILSSLILGLTSGLASKLSNSKDAKSEKTERILKKEFDGDDQIEIVEVIEEQEDNETTGVDSSETKPTKRT